VIRTGTFAADVSFWCDDGVDAFLRHGEVHGLAV
jgi:hypothetical protein